MAESEFLARFVVRKEMFERMFNDIATADYSVPQQHYVIIGQRGQGKTTLLRRIKIACLHDLVLADKLIPVKFSEEQYQIRSLVRLWEEVADTLHADYPMLFSGLVDKLEKLSEEDDYQSTCFACLDEAVRSTGKNILLLIDNIDQLFDKLSLKEQRTLREILTVSPTYRIIGGSTKMLEHHFDYSKPFFEFFRIEKLTGLTSNECVELLRALAGDAEKEKIEKIIAQNPERIELLRRLTGGVPRTMVMLFDIFMDESGNAFQDLMKVLDEVTPLYKHRMDDLPAQLQDIMHAIAINWDGMSGKEIAKETGLETNAISAQLSKLEKIGVVYSEAIGKNKVYQITERFFNIWYLMRFGRKKDRQRVEWLVKFLESWCTPEELKNRAKSLMDSMNAGKAGASHVFHMTEALCYAGLDANWEDSLKKSARGYLEQCDPELGREISPSDWELYEKAGELLDNKKFDDALEVALQIKRKSGLVLNLLGIIYAELKNYSEAEKCFLSSIEKGDINALNNIAIFYYDQKMFAEAEKYYLLAINEGHKKAFFNIACLYHDQQKFVAAEKYYLLAIENGLINAFNNLGVVYRDQQKFAEAEKYYLLAIENGDEDALNNLANVYKTQNNITDAEKYYFLAIERGVVKAFFNIAIFYHEQQRYMEAEKYYLLAIESGDLRALDNYALFLYERASNPEKALSLITQSFIQQKTYHDTHTLALIQLWNDQFSESYTTFTDWLHTYKDTLKNDDIIEYLTLLLAQKQLHRAKSLFELPEYQFKDRIKPFWYALARLMSDEMKTEAAKMGRELEESVIEILARVKEYQEKYHTG